LSFSKFYDTNIKIAQFINLDARPPIGEGGRAPLAPLKFATVCNL